MRQRSSIKSKIGRIAVAGAALVLLQACMIGGIYPDMHADGSAEAATTDETGEPKAPAKPATQPAKQMTTAPAPKPAPKPEAKPAASAGATVRDSDVTEERTRIDLSVTYLVRLLVPAGSKLEVQARGPGGTVTRSVYTGRNGPPYAISLPVGADATYPMTITATLQSTAGHVLRGEAELAGMPEDTVEIVMMPTAGE